MTVAPAGQAQQWQAGEKGSQFMDRSAFEQQKRFGRRRYRLRSGGHAVTPLRSSTRRCRGSQRPMQKTRRDPERFQCGRKNKEARASGPLTLTT